MVQHVEIIFIFQVTVAHIVVGVYRGGVDADIENGVRQAILLEDDLALETGEVAAGHETEIPYRKADGGALIERRVLLVRKVKMLGTLLGGSG